MPEQVVGLPVQPGEAGVLAVPEPGGLDPLGVEAAAQFRAAVEESPCVLLGLASAFECGVDRSSQLGQSGRQPA